MRASNLFAVILFLHFCAPVHANDFYDWTVGCDNVRGCTALGFALQGQDGEGFIRLERAGGSDSPANISLTLFVEGAIGTASLRLTIDGKPIEGVAAERRAPSGQAGRDGFTTEISPQELKPFIAALRKGMTLNLAATDGKLTVDLSLRGALAALVNIDDIQGRVGTETALIRKEDKTHVAVVNIPSLPVIVPAKLPPNLKADPALAIRLRERLKKEDPDRCADLPNDASFTDEVDALDDSRALVGLICSTGAYNIVTDFWIVTGADVGKAVPVVFEAPDHTRGNSVVNAEFDRQTGTITFFRKDRGLGDCGATGKYIWTGTTFTLFRYAALEPCRGVASEDWPILWRAKAM